MNEYELRPCPFCGAPAHKWSWNGGTRIDCSAWDISDKHTHYVGIGAKTEQEAIEAWNRRTNHENSNLDHSDLRDYQGGTECNTTQSDQT